MSSNQIIQWNDLIKLRQEGKMVVPEITLEFLHGLDVKIENGISTLSSLFIHSEATTTEKIQNNVRKYMKTQPDAYISVMKETWMSIVLRIECWKMSDKIARKAIARSNSLLNSFTQKVIENKYLNYDATTESSIIRHFVLTLDNFELSGYSEKDIHNDIKRMSEQYEYETLILYIIMFVNITSSLHSLSL